MVTPISPVRVDHLEIYVLVDNCVYVAAHLGAIKEDKNGRERGLYIPFGSYYGIHNISINSSTSSI